MPVLSSKLSAAFSRPICLLAAAFLLMSTGGCPAPASSENNNAPTDGGQPTTPGGNNDSPTQDSPNPDIGSADEPDTPDEPVQSEPDPDAPFDLNLDPVPFQLIEEAVLNASQATTAAVDAVIFATAQGSGSAPKPLNAQANFMIAGTISEDAGQFTYSPDPSDRLVVNTSTLTGEFIFASLLGNLTATSSQFLESDHQLDVTFTFTEPQAFTGRITSLRQRRSPTSFTSDRASTLEGTWTSNGIEVQANLNGASEIFFEVDSTGSEFRDTTLYTGTIDAGNQATTVDDSWLFELVTADQNSSSVTLRTSNSTFTNGTNNYRYQDVRLSTQFRNGVVSNTDNWFAEGQMLRNGEAVATFELADEGDFMKLYLNAGEGNRREISSWQK